MAVAPNALASPSLFLYDDALNRYTPHLIDQHSLLLTKAAHNIVLNLNKIRFALDSEPTGIIIQFRASYPDTQFFDDAQEIDGSIAIKLFTSEASEVERWKQLFLQAGATETAALPEEPEQYWNACSPTGSPRRKAHNYPDDYKLEQIPEIDLNLKHAKVDLPDATLREASELEFTSVFVDKANVSSADLYAEPNKLKDTITASDKRIPRKARELLGLCES